MKAEHRKELETNILADRMGNLIQRMKGGPKRRTIVYVFLSLLLVLISIIVYFYWQGDKGADAQRWLLLEFGEFNQILSPSEKNNMTFKVAELQFLHFFVWDQGVANLGSDPKKALDALERLEQEYGRVKEECKGDTELEAEADYAVAVIEESRASVDIKRLASARTKYEEVAKAYPKTRFGKLAELRHKHLTVSDNMSKVTEFYKDLNKRFELKQWEDKMRAEKAVAPKKGPPK